MKKLLAFCCAVLVSACSLDEGLEFWEKRGAWVESFQTYAIKEWPSERRLVKTSEVNEKSAEPGSIRTVFRGYSLLSDKTFRRSYYVLERVRANMNATLSSVSVPYRFKKNQLADIVGTSNIDGEEYRLIKTDLDDFVLLIDQDGKFYRSGQIRNGRLAVLDVDYIVSNPDFRLVPVMITSTSQTAPVKGFDIKYDGLRLNRIWFTYFDYSTDKAGGFQDYSFPKEPGLITLGDVQFRVLQADDQRLDYMLISDD